MFSFLFLFNFSIFFNIVSFFLSGDFLILLVLLFKSIFGGLINVIPHLTNDFSDFCDFGIGVFGPDFVINFPSKQEECGKSSFRSRGLN
jgi:hypothetical protein